MSYSLGLTPAQANLEMGWTPAKSKAYWDARAQACTQYGDEGECLAQVARHVPVTIGGLERIASAGIYAHPDAGWFDTSMAPSGLGVTTTVQDVATALNVTAGLFRDPDATLRRYGPPIVTAADQHIVTPLMQRIGKATAPYLVKYILPPIAILYVLTGISAYYSYRSARKLAANPSRRRRRRKRRKRRTSRR